MLTPLILIALCIGMGVLQWLKGWKVGSWLQVAVVAVWMGSQFLGGTLLGLSRLAAERGVVVTPCEGFLYRFLFPAIGAGVLFLLVARLPSRRSAAAISTSGGSISAGAASEAAELATRARKALLTAFPEFAPCYRELEDGAAFEIRFPHPAVPLELLVTSRNSEISIFFDQVHRHIGMCQNLSPEGQADRAVAFLRGLFDGTIPLVRDLRWEGYDFCDEPGIWRNDPERNLVFTTWKDLGLAA